ncbi:DUF885 domain-containing protein [Catenovulum sp. SM1970]|uniref:DUF885 domain-containing protein n=1 Tax=Marinifaba aquimaris TaxID=2741323 RepID=UPI00157317F9|nr:DUF885 domain-containing protein [Marinifaba aquimaris]NTS76882.1 DUF885 domain-containing protein [Marinifaba aquimaris]
MKNLLLASSMLCAFGVTTSVIAHEGHKHHESILHAEIKTADQALNKLTEIYFQASLKYDPVSATFAGEKAFNDDFYPEINEANRAEQLKFEKHFLAELKKIDRNLLTAEGQITYDHFKYLRELNIEGFSFPSYQIPFNQMYGVHNFFAVLGSGQSGQPFVTFNDYLNFITRSEGYIKYMDSALSSMKQGAEQGVVLPKVLVEKLLPQFATHISGKVEDSIFWQPIANFSELISDVQRKELEKAYRELITKQIQPSYKKAHDFLKNEYLAKASDTVGYSDLPNGSAWYEYKIKQNTSLDFSAEEIHEYGQQEVARILAEMKKVKEQVNFDGDLASFFEFLKTDEQFYFKSEKEVVNAYQTIKTKIDKAVPSLFEVFPKADYIIKPVEAFRAQSAAGASYQSPAPDGSRPGVFYINTYNLKAQPKFLLETLSVHEASPGHHFQISIQQELKDVPKFRRFAGSTVFAEGWALYAESLGKEMGLFSDPYMWYGRLSDEQLRAMRLVVDTGLHAKGWSREQAIDFMKKNSSLAESDIIAEVERYIAIPGQALAYKMGERAIRDLRTLGEKELKDKFDIKAFHTQVLSSGSVPMPILQNKIKAWINSQK